MSFEVWAPYAQHGVQLVLSGELVPMEPTGGGWWRCDREPIPGTRYEYAIDGGTPRPDPRAMRLPEGVTGPAEVFDVAGFAWTDDRWHGLQLAGAVLYELHVGTFTPEGTLDAAITRLDHLVELGVDIVNVMPVATFPGGHGWGYDGVGLYAVHEPYGGPAALCRFVDACHAVGIGVVLDVVYNHFGPTGNYLSEFGPYFTDRYGTPWGDALNLDGPDSDEVRRFIIDNAVSWLRDFHVDGLRLDAVHALFDDRAIAVLEELTAEIDALSTRLGRPLWLIAESDRNDTLTVTPREAGGLGVDAQWCDDVHHALHVLLTGETHGYYADFADPRAIEKTLTGMFFHDGTYSSFRRRTHGRPVDRLGTFGWRFVVSLQTHDQVGNRALGDRLSDQLSPGRLACGAALRLTSAATPMLFMGEEWGASTPWQYFTDHIEPHIAQAVKIGRRGEFTNHGWSLEEIPDPQARDTMETSKLRWDEVDDGDHARLLAWYADLIAVRRVRHDLRDHRLDQIVVRHDPQRQVVLVRRGNHTVVVNLSPQPLEIDLPWPLVHSRSAGLAEPERELVLAWDEAGTELLDERTLRLPAESPAVVGTRWARNASSPRPLLRRTLG